MLTLSPLPKTWLFDVDGTIVKHNGHLHGGDELLEGVKEFFAQISTEDEVRDFCREKIANYKIPKYVNFVDSYPMTASGKIQKFKMREMAIKELHLEDMGETA